MSLENFLPAQDGDDGDVGDKTGDADDELQDDLQPEVDHGVRLHVLKRVDESAVGWLVGSVHFSVSYRAEKSPCTWFGEVCFCFCLSLLPQLACNILATTCKDFFSAL